MAENRGGNYWTNNIAQPADGPRRTAEPTAGTTRLPMTVMGTSDDRVISTDPAREIGQFRFIVSEAKLARLLKEQEPEYASVCLAAARRAYDWARRERIADNAGAYAALIDAAVVLYEATGEEMYRNDAVRTADLLLQLQERESAGSNTSVSGFFYHKPDREAPHRVEPERSGYMAPILIGLTELLEAFPDHSNASAWKEAVALYAREYVATMAGRNAFGIMPIGLYAQPQGGDRRIGRFWYRYFMAPSREWWVGINANLAATGVGLMKAARILGDPELAALAQRQMDWIVGANPFHSSTIVGVGYNQPKEFVTREFRPPTPSIIGAVMNGQGGTEEDEPFYYNNGEWQVGEYWLPMVAYTFWLMAELQLGM